MLDVQDDEDLLMSQPAAFTAKLKQNDDIFRMECLHGYVGRFSKK